MKLVIQDALLKEIDDIIREIGSGGDVDTRV